MSTLYSSVVDSLNPARAGGTHVQKRIDAVTALDAYAARRTADALEALIIELGTSALAGISEWPDAKGLDVLPTPIESGPSGRTRILVQLSETRFRQVFRALCADICGVLAAATNERDAVAAFHRRLVRWQSFLQRHAPEGLGGDARCGLFGELLVLRDLILPNIPHASALRSWRGSKKAHQDFQFSRLALEVKTSRATLLDRVSVSNVQQLDDDGVDKMFLTVVHVHENESTGESLPAIIDDLRSILTDDCRDLLDDGLQEVGYLDAHRQLYERTLYQPIDTLHFEVRVGFPRLVRSAIPSGIKSVKYQLAIEACRSFLVDRNSIVQALSAERIAHDR